MNVSKVITLLFIGAVGGILIAPSKGSKTRKRLSKTVNDFSVFLQDIVDTVKGEVNTPEPKRIPIQEER